MMVSITMQIFAFSDAADCKILATALIHAFNAVWLITTVIYAHPSIAIGAVEVKVAFLFATDALATAIFLLIGFVTIRMNSIMTVALRFRINALDRRWRWRRRWLRRRRWRSWPFTFALVLINVNRQCHSRRAKEHERHGDGNNKFIHKTSLYSNCNNNNNILNILFSNQYFFYKCFFVQKNPNTLVGIDL